MVRAGARRAATPRGGKDTHPYGGFSRGNHDYHGQVGLLAEKKQGARKPSLSVDDATIQLARF